MAIFTHCRIIRGTWRHMVKPICTLKTKFYIVLMAITFILVLVFKISYDNNSMGTICYMDWYWHAGGAIVGMLFYKESTHFSRIIFIFLILFSVIGLKMI